MHDLAIDLAGGKGAREARSACCAEGAAHGAARLRGCTHGQTLASGHADALHGSAIGKAQQVFAAAVFADLLGKLLHAAEREALGKRGAQRLGQIAHLVKRGGALLPQPFLDLLSPELGLPQLFERGKKLGVRDIVKVLHECSLFPV